MKFEHKVIICFIIEVMIIIIMIIPPFFMEDCCFDGLDPIGYNPNNEPVPNWLFITCCYVLFLILFVLWYIPIQNDEGGEKSGK